MKTPAERLHRFTQKVTLFLWFILLLLFLVLWNNSANAQPSVNGSVIGSSQSTNIK